MLADGASIDDKNDYGNNAFYWAAFVGHLPVVTALLAVLGSNVDEKNNYG